MKKRVLGRSGLQVSEVSLGAWQFGGTSYGPVSEADAHATIGAYLDGGGNFIDTARRYGDSEKILGQYFAQHGGREGVILASKTHRLDADGIRSDLAESLRFLNTDYIDLYYLHSPPEDSRQMGETLNVFAQLKSEGHIRAIGASIKGPDVTGRTVDLCRLYLQTGRVDALMVIYSIFRQAHAAWFDEARSRGVGIVARTVLENGFLSGKYSPGHTFRTPGDHRARWSSEKILHILSEAQELKARLVVPPYISLTEGATRFVLDSDAVSSVVVGARNAAQIEGSMKASSLPSLSTDAHDYLRQKFKNRCTEFNVEEPGP